MSAVGPERTREAHLLAHSLPERAIIADFLRQRGAARLADAATERLGALLNTVECSASGEEQRLRLYSLFAECRFGFREALKVSGDESNGAARDGLAAAVETMVGYELDNGDPRAASTLLAEIETPNSELRERVERALATKQEEQRRIESLAREGQAMDPGVGQRTRAFIVLVLGLGFTVGPLIAKFSIARYGIAETHFTSALWRVSFLMIMLGLGIWARESLTRSRYNQRAASVMLFVPLAGMLLQVVASLAGIEPADAYVFEILIWFSVATVGVFTIEWRLFPTALGYLIACLVVARWRELRFHAMSASNFVLAINAALVWRVWRPSPTQLREDSPTHESIGAARRSR